MTPLEERIGYKFRNSLLLAEALTHPSLGHEAQRYHFDYQRLEFLGDAVLQLVITQYLFGSFRVAAEGQLTKLRSRLVSRDALRTHAAALDLGRYILMGRGEKASGGRERTSTLADAFEALIGALYLDGGQCGQNFILTQTRSRSAETGRRGSRWTINPKGRSSGAVAGASPPTARFYELISQNRSRAPRRTFRVSQVVWEGIRFLAQGSGRSKKQAETAAALESVAVEDVGIKKERNSTGHKITVAGTRRIAELSFSSPGNEQGRLSTPTASRQMPECVKNFPRSLTSTGNAAQIDLVHKISCHARPPVSNEKEPHARPAVIAAE